MTQEDVIKGLECLAKQHGIVGVCEPENCPYGDLHTCANEIARDALTLLEAQKAKLVHVMVKINYRKIGECPTCDKLINSGYYPNYCGVCGQAVKWK